MWEAVAEASLNALLELFHFTKFDGRRFREGTCHRYQYLWKLQLWKPF